MRATESHFMLAKLDFPKLYPPSLGYNVSYTTDNGYSNVYQELSHLGDPFASCHLGMFSGPNSKSPRKEGMAGHLG